MSDSIYNMHELCLWGANKDRSVVIHPFNNIGLLRLIEPDMCVVDQYLDDLFNIITVGRVVPNKGFDYLLEIFSLYNRSYNPKSRLIIVGERHAFLHEYAEYIDQRIKSLELEDKVVFTGKISDAQLKAYYFVSKAYLLTSHHEGFCVPLVEAMAFKIPAIVYLNAAIKHTVGDAAIGWDDLDSRYFAASINRIATDEELYAYFCQLGAQRYEKYFSNDAISLSFYETIKPWI